ncbi:TPA: hypothetical protein N0F65_006522 [Lagenidium giganteum]|uniref:glucan 1,3-beta-glucosidase n=1 Tax=Lagenidium giganteum TaxID=4803 RepID=A0AAV2YJJ7_9STRA|nr:TPA: hypothetical protein N0F65_006522 [Lagenidium giganteum]
MRTFSLAACAFVLAAAVAPAFAQDEGYQPDDTNLWSGAFNELQITENLRANDSKQTAHIQPRIRSGQVPSRGVNLGGWLVAEHWMTTGADIWDGVSEADANKGEYTALTVSPDPNATKSHFDHHHATFVTEKDIAEIAAAGLNTVRVPVGYWIMGTDNHDTSQRGAWTKFAPNAIKYLDLLIKDWARKHNVAVIISMHAAKGSQNGQDHSSPENSGKSDWAHYPENVANTIDVVSFLAKRYKSEVAFLGIGLLNEPGNTTPNDVLYKYYEDAYKVIRGDGNDCVLTVAPLLWEQSPKFMADFMKGPEYKNVWVEWHRYFVWGFEQATEADLMGKHMPAFDDDLAAWKGNPMFIGEWSFATSGKFQNDDEGYHKWARKQLEVINKAKAGYTFWSWRIYGDENGSNGWSLRNMLRNKVVSIK